VARNPWKGEIKALLRELSYAEEAVGSARWAIAGRSAPLKAPTATEINDREVRSQVNAIYRNCQRHLGQRQQREVSS